MELIKVTEIKGYPKRNTYGIFRCHCGKEFETKLSLVKTGRSKSCGCLRTANIIKSKTKHGLSRTRFYQIWADMLSRCNNIKTSNFKNYGGAGISVCKEWHSFENFKNDMYDGYSDDLMIDRINTYGNYEPSNCRWANRSIQNSNKKVIMSTNKSGYRGVSFDKTRNLFTAHITVNKKQNNLGRFKDPKEAAMAYDTFVIVYGLEHTTNFPKGVFAK